MHAAYLITKQQLEDGTMSGDHPQAVLASAVALLVTQLRDEKAKIKVLEGALEGGIGVVQALRHICAPDGEWNRELVLTILYPEKTEGGAAAAAKLVREYAQKCKCEPAPDLTGPVCS